MKIYFNGKFLTQATTGVQRYARGLISGLDAVLASAKNLPRHDYILLCPLGAPKLNLLVIKQVWIGGGLPFLKGALWEQIVLPWASRKGLLLNFSGSAPLFGRRQIISIHDAALYLYPSAYSKLFVFWYLGLFKKLSRQSFAVITVSKNSAYELQKFLPRVNFTVIYNSADHVADFGINNKFLNDLQLSPGAYVLAVGSLNPTKNIDRLIHAYSESNLVGRIPLVLVGGANMRVFSSRASSEPSLKGIVHAGVVSDEELKTLYSSALAFVFPSIYEGFGIPPLEAMKCNCPVIASSAASIPEVCGSAAYYFDPLSGNDIKRALEHVVADSNLRAELILQGAARVNDFSWMQSGRTLLELINEACD